jgi:hypothetical protein
MAVFLTKCHLNWIQKLSKLYKNCQTCHQNWIGKRIDKKIVFLITEKGL